MCAAARRYGREPREIAPAVRRLYRRHCAGVASGEFAREQGLLQSTRAYQRTLPRLALCARRDRRAVALRRRGGNWSEVARRCGCSVRTAQGASERLARLNTGKMAAFRLVNTCSVPALSVYRTPRFVVHLKFVHRPKGGFARAAGALNLPRLSARRRERSDGLVMGEPGGGNGRGRAGRRQRCRSMRGCVGSGSRCCAGNPDSEPIRGRWRMLSSGPRRVVVSTTTGAAPRPLVLRPGRCGVVGGRRRRW